MTRVSGPTSGTYLNWPPIFEWCVARCRSKNRHQEDMCWKIDLTTCSKTILCSIVITNWRDLCGPSYGSLLVDFDSSQNSRLAPKLSGINPGFFRYIPRCTEISTSQTWVLIRWHTKKSNQIKPVYIIINVSIHQGLHSVAAFCHLWLTTWKDAHWDKT